MFNEIDFIAAGLNHVAHMVTDKFEEIQTRKKYSEQLIKKGIDPNGRFRFTEENMVEIVNAIEELKYLSIDAAPRVTSYTPVRKVVDHYGTKASAATQMKEDGTFEIIFSTSAIKTNLDFSYNIGHEFGHVINEMSMSYQEWSEYVKTKAIYREEISVWKNINLPAGDPTSLKAIQFYENMLNR